MVSSELVSIRKSSDPSQSLTAHTEPMVLGFYVSGDNAIVNTRDSKGGKFSVW